MKVLETWRTADGAEVKAVALEEGETAPTSRRFLSAVEVIDDMLEYLEHEIVTVSDHTPDYPAFQHGEMRGAEIAYLRARAFLLDRKKELDES